MYSAQRILLVAGSILCIILLKYTLDNDASPRRRVDSPEQQGVVDGSPDRERITAPGGDTSTTGCQHLDGLERIVIVLKTGSTEIYEKLPIHFTTTFACNPDRLIYSDAQQEFSGHLVRDTLALGSDDLRSHAQEFEQYRELQSHLSHGGSAAHLKGDKSWQLDKWKFLPMISDAYDVFGDTKLWYVFIEADTYLSLHNLMLWLDELDATDPIYTGAQVMIDDTEFAHGGSGFMLSAGAARALSEAYREDQPYWEDYLSAECCGDKVVADVLLDASPPVGLLRSFPMIQGEILASLDWSAVHWCRPAVTWHHVDAPGIDRLWQFDRNWMAGDDRDQPILFRDYYDAFIHPRLAAADWYLVGWDNLSNDWSISGKDQDNTYTAHESEAACEAFCRQIADCLQWSWTKGTCRGGRWVRLGWDVKSRPGLGSAEDRIEDVDGQDELVSGWFSDRIEEFIDRMEPCVEEDFWLLDD